MGSLCSREVNFEELENAENHPENDAADLVTVPLWTNGEHLSDSTRTTRKIQG